MDGGDVLIDQRRKEIEDEIEALEADIEVIPLKDSDPWVKGLEDDHFVMVDPPNKRIMVYGFLQDDSMTLKSLRNTDLDVRIPEWPLPRRDLFEKDREMVNDYLQLLKRTGHLRADRATHRKYSRMG